MKIRGTHSWVMAESFFCVKLFIILWGTTLPPTAFNIFVLVKL